MHSYWATIFILPKKVLKDIRTICRNYIWSGKATTNRPPLPKREAGLGINDCVKWNQAAIAKYFGMWQKRKKIYWENGLITYT